MDWLAPALSAGSSLLGSLFSAHSANKALNAQRQENALNRQFNAAEAQKSRDFQLDMFNRENAYNDPKAVVGRLMNAGMNPALAFGNIADSASVSGSSAASYGSGVNPPMPDWSGISAAGRAMLDQEMLQAQIDLVKAQTAKTNTETDWIPKVQQSITNLNNSGFDLNISRANLTDGQARLIEPTLNKLNKEIDILKNQGKISEEQYKQALSESNIRKVEEQYKESSVLADFFQRLANIRLTNEQAIRTSTLLTAEFSNLVASARLSNSLSEGYEFNNSLNDAVKALKGIGGLADDKIQAIEAGIKSIFTNIGATKAGVDIARSRLSLDEFNSAIGAFTSILSVGIQALSASNAAASAGAPRVTNIYNNIK